MSGSFQLGRHSGLANAAYQAADAVSKSRLDVVATDNGGSPLAYWAKYLDPNRVPEEPTKALIDGQAAHDALLSPEVFATGYVMLPSQAPRRPTKAQLGAKKPSEETLYAIDFWREWDASANGKILLDPEQYEMAQRIAQAVRRHPVAGPLFTGGEAEVSYFAIDPEFGVPVKCRPDYERPSMIVDFKTTIDASPDGFGRSAWKWRYPVQGAWYPDVVEAAGGEEKEHFVFVAAEKEEPYAIGVYTLEEEDQRLGRKLARRDLRSIVQCEREYGRGVRWPDHGYYPQPLEIPAWGRRKWQEAA